MKKVKVINIINHPPAYDEYSDKPKPAIYWDMPNGDWVGIWGHDWANVLGENILKYSDNFEYEVWQPDNKADKIYEYHFNSGLVHKLFPAKKIRFLRGFYFDKGWKSSLMISSIKKLDKRNKTIFILNGSASYLEYSILNEIIFKHPFIFLFYHNLQNFLAPKKKSNNLIKKLHRKLFYSYQKNYLIKGNYAVSSNFSGKDEIEKQYGLTIFPLRWGLDLEFWDRKIDKNEARKKLNLLDDEFIIFSLNRLTESKQTDKFIDCLVKFRDHNFKYLIAGHGNKHFEKFLAEKIKKFKLNDKVILLGYISNKELLYYLNAVDLFISTSSSEAGPMSTLQAMLFEIPIISTNTGFAAELLFANNAGYLISTEYDCTWDEALKKVFNGYLPPIMDSIIIKKLLNWKLIIKEWEIIFQKLI